MRCLGRGEASDAVSFVNLNGCHDPSAACRELRGTPVGMTTQGRSKRESVILRAAPFAVRSISTGTVRLILVWDSSPILIGWAQNDNLRIMQAAGDYYAVVEARDGDERGHYVGQIAQR